MSSHGVLVEDAVEDLGPEMGHADVVDVGERQHHARVDRRRILVDRLILAAQVAGGLVHAVDEVGVDMAHGETGGPEHVAHRPGQR